MKKLRLLSLLALGSTTGLTAQDCSLVRSVEIDQMGTHFDKMPTSFRVELNPDTVSFFYGSRSKQPLMKFVVKSCEVISDAQGVASGIMYDVFDFEEGESKQAKIHYRFSSYVEILYPEKEPRVLYLKKE